MLKKVLAAVFVSSLLFISSNAKAESFTNNQAVDKNKSWTIHFNQEVAFDDATRNAIVVTDSRGNKVNVPVNLGSDNKSVVVGVPEVGGKYELTIGNCDGPTCNMELYTINKDGSQKQIIDSSVVSNN